VLLVLTGLVAGDAACYWSAYRFCRFGPALPGAHFAGFVGGFGLCVAWPTLLLTGAAVALLGWAARRLRPSAE